jgi:hypothetical protein
MMDGIAIAVITAVLGPILVIVAKYYLDRRKPKADMLVDALEQSEIVTSKLEKIREEYLADRVWITQFHNGGHFYPTGKSIAKLSMVYEVVSPGTVSVQTGYQNIPVGLFSKSLNYLLEHEVIHIEDFKDEKIATHGLKYIAENHGTKSQYGFAMKTIDGKFVGVLGMDYSKRKTRLEPDDMAHIAVLAATIGGVLNGESKKHYHE